MSVVADLRRSLETLEHLLDGEYWEMLVDHRSGVPEGSVDPSDLQALVAIKAHVDELRVRVAAQLESVRAELESTPTARRAAKAYLSAAPTPDS